MKTYRIRCRMGEGKKSWWVPAVGRVTRMCYGKEFTRHKIADKDEALKLAERIARSNCFVWVKVMYGKEKLWERKP